jgi:hypothetical protein
VKFRLRVFVVDRLADAIRDPLMYEVMTFSSAGYVLSLTIGFSRDPFLGYGLVRC